jgi:hypothetical protein
MKTWRISLFTLLLGATTSALAFASDRAIRSIGQLGFGFGPSVEALIQFGRFGMPAPQGWAYAHRMPFVVVFLYLLHQLLHQFWLVYIAKDLVCSCAVIFIINKAQLPVLYSMAFLAFVYGVPFNASVAARLDSEEAYLFFILMAALWMALDQRRSVRDYALLGLLLAVVYLTKSSTGLLCFALATIVLVQSKARLRQKWIAAIPLGCTMVAALGWASYIEHKTGVFAIGTSTSSWNGWNFHKGNNPYSADLYPTINLDTLDATPYLTPPGSDLCRDEWCLSDLQMQAGKQFFFTHPRQILRMDLEKLAVVFWRLKEAPTEHSTPRLRVTLSLLIDHLVLLTALLLCLLVRDRGALTYLTGLACYILPFFSSFLYHRHMLPAYGMSAVFILYRAGQRWNKARTESKALPAQEHTQEVVPLSV